LKSCVAADGALCWFDKNVDDGTPLTAELAAASLAKAGALRGRATVSAGGGECTSR
jgi:hypothetical protein